jgi:hypothetical protein
MSDHETTHTHGDGAMTTSGSHAAATGRRAASDPPIGVRAADIEPYTGLGYLSKLFRIIAVFLAVLLLVEIGMGLYREGSAALPTLMSEASRLVVLAGLLWGVGDLANLLIDVGHDVRAARILLGRQVAHANGDRSPDRERGGERAERVERVVDRGGAAFEPRPTLAADRADPELHP